MSATAVLTRGFIKLPLVGWLVMTTKDDASERVETLPQCRCPFLNETDKKVRETRNSNYT